MKRFCYVLFIVVMIFGLQSGAQAFFLNFENGTELAEVTDITGVSFETFNGYHAIYSDIRTGKYNATSDDLGTSYLGGQYHMYGNFAIWAGANADAQGLKVDFTMNDGTWFTTGYAAYSTFYLEAYFTDGTSATVAGGANLGSPMSFLTVNAAAGTFLDYVVLHDTGNFWIADNMSGDASGIPNQVPEPMTLLLFGSGLVGVGILRRK